MLDSLPAPILTFQFILVHSIVNREKIALGIERRLTILFFLSFWNSFDVADNRMKSLNCPYAVIFINWFHRHLTDLHAFKLLLKIFLLFLQILNHTHCQIRIRWYNFSLCHRQSIVESFVGLILLDTISNFGRKLVLKNILPLWNSSCCMWFWIDCLRYRWLSGTIEFVVYLWINVVKRTL